MRKPVDWNAPIKLVIKELRSNDKSVVSQALRQLRQRFIGLDNSYGINTMKKDVHGQLSTISLSNTFLRMKRHYLLEIIVNLLLGVYVMMLLIRLTKRHCRRMTMFGYFHIQVGRYLMIKQRGYL